MEPYWDAPSVHHLPIKYESENGGYSFCTSENGGNNYGGAGMTFSEDDAEFATKRVKPTRQDPLSHRIIEKRRRDRMNSCLADLSRLIPPQYQRKSRGRIEKTEIIEMAIKHIKNIQAKADGVEPSSVAVAAAAARQCFQVDQYREGYHECLTTAVQFLIEVSAHFEELCFKMVSHLREHFNDVIKGDHCPNSSSSSTSSNNNIAGGGGGGLNNFQQQLKRRQQDNASPPSTTTGTLNGLGQFLVANSGGVTDPRSGGGNGDTASPMEPRNGTGPRVAHLCGSINGHSSSGSSAANGKMNGNCGEHPTGEGVPSSSDGQEMNCAKDLSCRGANSSNNINSCAQSTTTTSAAASVCGGSGMGLGGSKDGGCRKAPQQTPVITSTACSTSVQSTSTCSTNADLLINVETESSSSALDHGCVLEAGASGIVCNGGRPGGCDGEGGNAGGGGVGSGGLVKVHNLTETSCDGVEHHYKYKHYMQQRFTHERFHDEHVVSNSSNELHDHHDHHDHPMSGPEPRVGAGGGSAGSGKRGAMAPPPVEPTDSNCSVDTFVAFNAKRVAAAAAVQEGLKGDGAMNRDREESHLPVALLLRDQQNQTVIKEEKMDTSPPLCSEAIGKVLASEGLPTARMIEGNQQVPRVKAKSRFASIPVPIFALHSHGAFYIPLTVDYDALVPYLGDMNLLDKNMAAIKALHPVNINIYAPF